MATTGFSTQVSLLRAGESLANEPGDLFAADTGGGAAPEGPWGGPVVLVRWSDADHVGLHYHPRARVFHARRCLHGIDVSYRPFW